MLAALLRPTLVGERERKAAPGVADIELGPA
jgi:hypothetical protein